MTPEERAELEAILGHHFQRPEELDRALTHRSHRQSSQGTDNERLEFLGDRVLGLIASEHLCRSFPDWDSGQLSKGLARVVSATSLHAAAKKLKLGHFLRLGPGEEKTGGRDKKRLLADAYEAILAAIYLDAGLAAAASFLRRIIRSRRRPRTRRPQIGIAGMAAATRALSCGIPHTQRIRPGTSESFRG
jgi:ribonuclease-3